MEALLEIRDALQNFETYRLQSKSSASEILRRRATCLQESCAADVKNVSAGTDTNRNSPSADLGWLKIHRLPQ